MYMYLNVPWLPWLQFICSYVFYPVAFLMGVAEEDCFEVAKLIGDKTFINEFYAYTRLSVYIKNRENLTWYGHVSFLKKIWGVFRRASACERLPLRAAILMNAPLIF